MLARERSPRTIGGVIREGIVPDSARLCQNRLQLEGLGPVPGTRVTSRAVGGRRSDTAALAPRVVLGAFYWVVKREDDRLLAFLSRNPEDPPDCSFISRSIRKCTPLPPL